MRFDYNTAGLLVLMMPSPAKSVKRMERNANFADQNMNPIGGTGDGDKKVASSIMISSGYIAQETFLYGGI